MITLTDVLDRPLSAAEAAVALRLRLTHDERARSRLAAMSVDGRAVAIVLRDRKCSTSYIQRRLSVGYNKAASLVERMEREGVVTEREDALRAERHGVRHHDAVAPGGSRPDDRVLDARAQHAPRVAARGPAETPAGAHEIVLPCRPTS